MKKPTHKQCRYCGEWFELPRYANPKRRFCTQSCSSSYRNAQPKWKKAHRKKLKESINPEVMRERALKVWRNPEVRARLSEKSRERSNSKEHLAWMEEHNKKLWADEKFRKEHSKRSSKVMTKLWDDPAYREKMSALAVEQNKQRWTDPEYREKVSRKIRIALQAPLTKKKQIKTARELAQRPETKARNSKMMKERWADPEQRTRMTENIRETAREKWRDDPAYREKKVAVLATHARSPKNRARMSELNKKQWSDPEYIAKKKAWWTPERKEAQAEANRKRWADPEYKARVSKNIGKAQKKRHARNSHQEGLPSGHNRTTPESPAPAGSPQTPGSGSR